MEICFHYKICSLSCGLIRILFPFSPLFLVSLSLFLFHSSLLFPSPSILPLTLLLPCPSLPSPPPPPFLSSPLSSSHQFNRKEVIKHYSLYVNNFTMAMQILEKAIKKKPKFVTFLRRKYNQSKTSLSLQGLLLKPIQRFPQYILFLQVK